MKTPPPPRTLDSYLPELDTLAALAEDTARRVLHGVGGEKNHPGRREIHVIRLLAEGARLLTAAATSARDEEDP